jgi:hypothetical protein
VIAKNACALLHILSADFATMDVESWIEVWLWSKLEQSGFAK